MPERPVLTSAAADEAADDAGANEDVAARVLLLAELLADHRASAAAARAFEAVGVYALRHSTTPSLKAMRLGRGRWLTSES